MKNIVKILLFNVGALCISNVYAETTYICVADKSAGFLYDQRQKTWNTATFNVSDSKYTLSQNSGSWKWKKIGEQSNSPIECEKQFTEYGYLNCNSGFTDIQFNKKNLRYIKIYRVGYVNVGIIGKDGEDTPNIEIGKCSPV
jgi:hypothetical protein